VLSFNVENVGGTAQRHKFGKLYKFKVGGGPVGALPTSSNVVNDRIVELYYLFQKRSRFFKFNLFQKGLFLTANAC
jgi:hypothetical protein